MEKKKIGEFLVEKKLITPEQVAPILEHGMKEKLRFGEAAIDLGFLSESDLARVFGRNFRIDFFHLESRFFPKQTMDALSVETMLRYGVIPLGSKSDYGFFKAGKTLNLGMLDPGRKDALQAAETEAMKQGEWSKTKIFLVLAEQFLEVMNTVYGIDSQQIATRGPEKLEPTLLMFLEEKDD